MTIADTNASEATAYYDRDDVAAFYRLCWGGADIHIGRYDTGAESVAEASQAMTRYLLSPTFRRATRSWTLLVAMVVPCENLPDLGVSQAVSTSHGSA